MKLTSLTLILISILVTACSNDSNYNRRTGEGNGVCNDNTNVTPLELEEDTAVVTDLNRLLTTGTLKTISARITYQGPTNIPGKENTTLVLGASSARGARDGAVLNFTKLCARNFSADLKAEQPIEIRIPISNKESKLVYNVYSFNYGPQFLTEEHLSSYMVLNSISSENEDFVDPFDSEPVRRFEDIINSENSKAYIRKVNREVPDSFDDENSTNVYTIAYEDTSANIRFHLFVEWTPDQEESDENGEENLNEATPQ